MCCWREKEIIKNMRLSIDQNQIMIFMFVQTFVFLVTGQHSTLLNPWYGFLAIILFLRNVKEAISLLYLIEFFRSCCCNDKKLQFLLSLVRRVFFNLPWQIKLHQLKVKEHHPQKLRNLDSPIPWVLQWMILRLEFWAVGYHTPSENFHHCSWAQYLPRL